MTNFVVSSVIPVIMRPSNLISTNMLAGNKSIRFYYKGGRDTVALVQSTENLFTVHIPQCSTITPATVTPLLIEVEKDLRADMKALNIGFGHHFLFDTKSKAILREESFIDYPPYYGIKHSLFMIYDEHGANDGFIRYLADTSEYGCLAHASYIMAFRELKTTQQADWSKTGKQLLTYLMSHRFALKGNFETDRGSWDTVTYPTRLTRDPSINLGRVTTTKALNIAAGLEIDAVAEENPFGVPPFIVYPEGNVLLSEILQIGLDSFLDGTYHDVIKTEIDFMIDTFKTVIIDTDAQICFVELQPGAGRTLEQIKQDFQTDNIQIVEGAK